MTKLSTGLISGIGALAILASAPAFADPYYQSANANWAGTYAGLHFGGTFSSFEDGGAFGPNGTDSFIMGGGQVGHNWQRDRLVFGVEGDFSKMDIESKTAASSFEEDWMATVRGRVGYAMDRLMPYATVGLGLTNVTASVPGVGADNEVEPGIAAGGGVDTMLSGNWSGRLEYLYVSVPRDDIGVGPGTTVTGGSDNHTIRAALNYKFY